MKRIYFVFSEIFSKFLPFLFLPYLTYKLGSVKMGELAIFQMVWAGLMPLMNAGFDTFLNRYYIRYGKLYYKNVLFNVFIVVVFIAFVSFIVTFLFFNSSIYLLAVVAAFFNSLYIIIISFFLVSENFRACAFFQILNSILLILFTFLIFEYFEAEVLYRAISVVVSFSLLVLYYFFRYGTGFKRLDKRLLVFVFTFCTPLFFNGLINFFRAFVDKIFVADEFSKSDLGVYTVAFQLSAVLILAMTAINKAFISKIYTKIKSGEYSVLPSAKVNGCFLVFSLILNIILSFIPRSFFELVLGDGFGDVCIYLFPMLMYSAFHFYYFYFSNYLIYTNNAKVLSFLSLLSIVFQVPLAYFLSFKTLFHMAFVPLFSLVFLVLIMALYSKLCLKGEMV